MKINLKNCCAVVTGASSGIGKELTKILISKYNCLVIGVARNGENLTKLQEELEQNYKKGKNFLPLSLDVSKKESWNIIFEKAKENEVKIIFNNAGTMLPFTKTSDVTEEEIDRVFKTNFYSIYYCFKVFNNYLENLGGDCGIVNITSSSSSFLIPGQSIYSASKSAATKLSLITASEVKHKYFVGTYLPGLTNTNIFKANDNLTPVVTKDLEPIINKLSSSAHKTASKIIKFTIGKKRFKIMGKDSVALKILKAFYKEKSSDFILNVFKKSKYETFKNIFN